MASNVLVKLQEIKPNTKCPSCGNSYYFPFLEERIPQVCNICKHHFYIQSGLIFQNVECIACEKIIGILPVLKNVLIINCESCEHINKIYYGKIRGKVLILWYKLISFTNKWLKSNWRKVRTFLGNKLISERTIYKSHCWSCRKDIIGVFGGGNINQRFGNFIYGNKPCPKDNYFICGNCGMCLHDLKEIRHAKEKVVKKWS